ncbi:MAG TPA: TOPRIM nucleotidyl transferase/hydrolase domain-containing protein, partial [Verrucomicrobiae bacterium]|nr:TOPRIM nucleotidyl transferase/hydrolase domain-containing protein [Verrucomicrobiae bacterium]
FKHLTVGAPAEVPFCRARLKAKWTPSTLAEGNIDQELVWVLSVDKAGVEKTIGISAAHRGLIIVHYIPATRDPIRHIRQSTGSILHGFLRAINWSPATKKAVSDASTSIRDAIGGEQGMKTVSALIESAWQELHKEGTHTNVIIQPVAKRIEDLIHQVDTVFHPSVGNDEEGVERLSDGQRSLFYIALVAMSFDVQNRLLKDAKHGLEIDKIKSPVLTILAVEEPENHVSPHFLGRIVGLLQRIGNDPAGQVLLTSHSASIMSRVEPESVRHLIYDASTKQSSIRRIELPTGNIEKEKFVREAVKAYPELYFSKLIILGEGDSEELVIPKLVKAIGGIELDPNLVSFVPLGGRHVNHFWKLLNGLGIPYITVLDLDFGRPGGGWGRIKYALEQLVELGGDPKADLGGLTPEKRATMHTWSGKDLSKELQSWLEFLEGENIYFSSPLDLDFAMLQAFPAPYKKLQPDERGPQAGTDDSLVAAVLGEKSPAAGYYLAANKDMLAWYRYLFLGRGKPATHSLAIQSIKDADLKAKAPDVLKRLVTSVVAHIQQSDDDEIDDVPF